MAKYRLDRKAFDAFVINSEPMRAELEDRAMRAGQFAEAIAPEETGEYKASFAVTSGLSGGVDRKRAWATLENYSDHAIEVEFGNSHQAGHHVLEQAAGLMGDRSSRDRARYKR
jgi:hypothetical protein